LEHEYGGGLRGSATDRGSGTKMTDSNDTSRGVAAMEMGGARGVSPAADAKTAGSNAEQHAENFFEFRDVCKSFDENAVLKDVSFTVKRGETCVIMGRSGVGKSVSLKHIMGFMKADSGRIFVDGEDVTDFTEQQFEEVRRKVTMVFQSGALFDSLTVAENIA
jgi:phospholipid/cholesterol/gamma-HCH transport system ATP-binding protein